MKRIISLTDTIKELLGWYILVLISCAVIFSLAENKSLLDSLWWASVTAMTVGYGDLYPVTLIGRIVGVLLMHVTVLLVLPLMIARVCQAMIPNRNEFTHEEQEEILQYVRKNTSIQCDSK